MYEFSCCRCEAKKDPAPGAWFMRVRLNNLMNCVWGSTHNKPIKQLSVITLTTQVSWFLGVLLMCTMFTRKQVRITIICTQS